VAQSFPSLKESLRFKNESRASISYVSGAAFPMRCVLMTTNPPAAITRIPTAAYFVAPLLYGGALGLHVLFPLFGERYLLRPLLWVLPWVLVVSLCMVGVRLLASPPRTWGLILSFFINLSASGFALFMTWLSMMFPIPG
jgi:hypothetical protein